MGKKVSKQRHKPRFSKSQIPWLIRGAIRSNNVETMQYLLSYPNEVDPNMVIDGVCPLNLAIELGHLHMVKLLIKAGADIHVADYPRYPLHQACVFGHAEIVDLLIRSGAGIAVQTENHESCLHLICSQSSERYLATARILLSHGADPNSLEENGLAPLHRASAEMIKLLASEESTNLNILSQSGDTPLLTAAKDRREAALLALIMMGVVHDHLPTLTETTAVCVSQRRASSKSPTTLMPGGSWARYRSQRVSRASSTAAILPTSARPYPETEESQPMEPASSLRSASNCLITSHSASFHVYTSRNKRNNPCVEHLKQQNTLAHNLQSPPKHSLNLDQIDNVGMTPLMICAEAGETGFRMAVALTSAGADLLAVDKMGMTALHHACYVGALSIARLLLEHSRVLQPSNPHLLDLQDRCGRTPTYLATCRGQSEVVNYLIACGSNIHTRNKELKSPLYIAANFGHLEIVTTLLRHGAKVNEADSHGKTPLYVAAYHGRLEIGLLLLEASARVNAADKNGRTPLYISVLHGHLALASRLLAAGALVDQADNEGLAPLHMAVKFPKLDIPMIKLLLSHGCDPLNLACFTRWLLGHSIIPRECIQGDVELAQWLRHEESNVRPLKRLCRTELQLALGSSESIHKKIALLPLPPRLQSYLSVRAL